MALSGLTETIESVPKSAIVLIASSICSRLIKGYSSVMMARLATLLPNLLLISNIVAFKLSLILASVSFLKWNKTFFLVLYGVIYFSILESGELIMIFSTYVDLRSIFILAVKIFTPLIV